MPEDKKDLTGSPRLTPEEEKAKRLKALKKENPRKTDKEIDELDDANEKQKNLDNLKAERSKRHQDTMRTKVKEMVDEKNPDMSAAEKTKLVDKQMGKLNTPSSGKVGKGLEAVRKFGSTYTKAKSWLKDTKKASPKQMAAIWDKVTSKKFLVDYPVVALVFIAVLIPMMGAAGMAKRAFTSDYVKNKYAEWHEKKIEDQHKDFMDKHDLEYSPVLTDDAPKEDSNVESTDDKFDDAIDELGPVADRAESGDDVVAAGVTAEKAEDIDYDQLVKDLLGEGDDDPTVTEASERADAATAVIEKGLGKKTTEGQTQEFESQAEDEPSEAATKSAG